MKKIVQFLNIVLFYLFFMPMHYVAACIDLSEITAETDYFPDDQEHLFDEGRPLFTAQTILSYITRGPCPVDPQTIIDAQAILRNDLYLYTNPLRQRSLLDMPQYYFPAYPAHMKKDEPWQLTLQLYYNQMNNSYYTRTLDTIDGYLALGDPSFVIDLESLGFNINLVRVYGILSNAKIVQYRVGAMMDYVYQYKKWWIQSRFPLEYMLRHFNLTPAEQEDLRRELAQEQDGESELEFAKRHLIADRAGIGDMRLDIGYTFDNYKGWHLVAGFEGTLPFAWAFRKGIYGNHFSKSKPNPSIDLIYLLNLLNTDLTQVQYVGTEFMLQALNRLSTILLETGLGNNGHVGIGTFAWLDIDVAPKLKFHTRAALEYLIPAFETRYYIKQKDIAEFDKVIDPSIVNCDKELLFLQEQLVNTLFPTGYSTRTYPGAILKITTALSKTFGTRGNALIGYDFWWQQQETFGFIDAPLSEKRIFKKDIARTPAAYQSKIFGSIGYIMDTDAIPYSWAISVKGDMTFLNFGIGNDFNLALCFEVLL